MGRGCGNSLGVSQGDALKEGTVIGQLKKDTGVVMILALDLQSLEFMFSLQTSCMIMVRWFFFVRS